MIETEIFAIVLWLVIIFVIQISSYLVLHIHLPKYALPLSFGTGLIFFMFLTWYLALLNIPPFVAFILMIFSGIFAAIKYRENVWTDLKEGCHYYILFFLTFIIWLVFILFWPEVAPGEQFMNHAFIASIMNTGAVPPLDPWMAGETLDCYYYLGHWLFAMLGLTTAIPSYYLINLGIPTIAAIAGVSLLGVGRATIEKYAILPVISFLMVNPATVLGLFYNIPFNQVLWISSRVIPDAVNEFPNFSLFLGHLHANVMAFIPQTSLILITTIALTGWRNQNLSARICIVLVAALSLAAVPVIHSWDTLVWAPIIVMTGIILLIDPICQKGSELSTKIQNLKSGFKQSIKNNETKLSLLFLFGVPVISLLIAGPVLLLMNPAGISGIGIVQKPSPVFSFIMVHGFFFLCLLLSLKKEILKYFWILALLIPGYLLGYLPVSIALILLIWTLSRHRDVGDFFAVFGLLIIVFVEFFYLQETTDISSRVNTVFKMYLCAWILLGTGAAIMIGDELKKIASTSLKKERFIQISLLLLFVLLLVTPLLTLDEKTLQKEPTIDGHKWILSDYPDDGAAIDFLMQLPSGNSIVEATKDTGTYYNRISALTGIPTILGWPGHEQQWRGEDETFINKKLADIKAIYEQPDNCIKIMRDYGVNLLYVGPLEADTYNISLPDSGLTAIYSNNNVTIYKLTD